MFLTTLPVLWYGIKKLWSEFQNSAQADGCFRTSASARIRIESAGELAVAEFFSNAGAIRFNFATVLLLR